MAALIGRWAAAALLALVAPLALSAAGADAAAGPRFFGVVPQESLSAAELGRIGRLGLTVRFGVDWNQVEPRRGEFEFGALDEAFREAAQHGVRVLPVLGGPVPSWAGHDPTHPALSGPGLRAWHRFVGRVVGRYGRDGAFWAGQASRLPVRRWQVWNEPNFAVFWDRPSAPAYVRVLHAAATAIRRADRRATVVAAGLAPIEGQPPLWAFLRRIYRVPGARRDFDMVAVHPYSSTLAGVEYVLRETRRTMAEAGDTRTPVLITEVGVASAAGAPTAFDRGPGGQARFLADTFERLFATRARWRLAGVYWFAWKDAPSFDPSCSFCQYSGLFSGNGEPKPSWDALRRVVGRIRRGVVR